MRCMVEVSALNDELGLGIVSARQEKSQYCCGNEECGYIAYEMTNLAGFN